MCMCAHVSVCVCVCLVASYGEQHASNEYIYKHLYIYDGGEEKKKAVGLYESFAYIGRSFNVAI